LLNKKLSRKAESLIGVLFIVVLFCAFGYVMWKIFFSGASNFDSATKISCELVTPGMNGVCKAADEGCDGMKVKTPVACPQNKPYCCVSEKQASDALAVTPENREACKTSWTTPPCEVSAIRINAVIRKNSYFYARCFVTHDNPPCLSARIVKGGSFIRECTPVDSADENYPVNRSDPSQKVGWVQEGETGYSELYKCNYGGLDTSKTYQIECALNTNPSDYGGKVCNVNVDAAKIQGESFLPRDY
jgi:hypothetical protein